MASQRSGKEADRNASSSLSDEEKRTAMWCHLSSLAGVVVPTANIMAPLYCWLSRKETSRFVNFHGKESLNFQINMLLYSLLGCPFCCVSLGAVPLMGWTAKSLTVAGGGLGLCFLLFAALMLYEIVISVFAGIKANEGEWYRYPYVLFRFFK
ncbi:MAG TPA: DUF4870 domain-containing protein [Gemmataceae bacterium]|jgi:hypothetical protein|nr:DUF4870 domain-containing protein [Gemmataceae bacterium]